MKCSVIISLILALPMVSAVLDPIPTEGSMRRNTPTVINELDQVIADLTANCRVRSEIDPITSLLAHKNVDFSILPIMSVRCPSSIIADIQKIHSEIFEGRAWYYTYNEHIQKILFERLMVLDNRYDHTTLPETDHKFVETYALLYNKLFKSPQISTQRQTGVQEASKMLISARLPLIEVFNGEKQPEYNNLLGFRSALRMASDLRVDANPFHPDERFLSDILRGLRAIQGKISQRMSSQ